MTKTQFQRAAGISAELAARWFPHIDAAMTEFGITGPAAQAMFIAQVGHESAGFTRVVENFNYSIAGLSNFIRAGRISADQAQMLGRQPGEKFLPVERQRAIANLVYGKRLGNKSAGDGWKFRGRGPIQISGLDNYLACGAALGVDLIAEPQLLERDEYGARSAAWFFVSRGCTECVEDVERVTKIINGGRNGIGDRRDRYKKALSVLCS